MFNHSSVAAPSIFNMSRRGTLRVMGEARCALVVLNTIIEGEVYANDVKCSSTTRGASAWLDRASGARPPLFWRLPCHPVPANQPPCPRPDAAGPREPHAGTGPRRQSPSRMPTAAIRSSRELSAGCRHRLPWPAARRRTPPTISSKRSCRTRRLSDGPPSRPRNPRPLPRGVRRLADPRLGAPGRPFRSGRRR